MAHPIKNVLEKVQTVLQADSPTIALLEKGANGVHVWKRLSVNDFNAMPKPFINIMHGLKKRNEVSSNTKNRWLIDVIIDYVKADSLELNILDDLADLDKIETVLLSKGVQSTAYVADSERSWVETEGFEMEPIFEGGYKTYRYTLTFAYDQNI